MASRIESYRNTLEDDEMKYFNKICHSFRIFISFYMSPPIIFLEKQFFLSKIITKNIDNSVSFQNYIKTLIGRLNLPIKIVLTWQMEVLLQGSTMDEFIQNFNVETADIFRNRPEYVHNFPIASVLIYFLVISFLPKLWGNRKLPGIKSIQMMWNGFLSILSILMLYGLARYWVNTIFEIGFVDTLCSKSIWTYGPSAFWGYIFALSKFIELFDTLWLILSGKEVPFLVSFLLPFLIFFSIGIIILRFYCLLGILRCGFSALHSFLEL
jgi:hypothetical protein